MSERIRILVSKCGLDGHDRGPRVVARAFRDAGFEVIYTGIHQTPEMVVSAAVQEDVDVIGISIHSAAHMTLFPKILRLLAEQQAQDKLVIGGGIIPDEDVVALQKLGVGRLFTPGASLQEMVDYTRNEVLQRRAAAR